MNEYKHMQIGWFIWVPEAIAVILSIAFGIVYKIWPLFIFSGLLLLAGVLFASLTVSVDDAKIKIAFGIGLIRKKFLLENINSACIVRNRWWYGWGIRYIGNGWLFNVSGLDAVELVMKNGKVYRIGTDEPQRLLEQIQTQLKQ